MTISSANRLELQQIIQSVSYDRGVEREVVVEAIEEAISKAARQRYGQELDIRAKYDELVGVMKLDRHRGIVEVVENPHTQINLEEARSLDPDAALGGELCEPMPPVNIEEMDRIIVQNAIQVILQRIREAERERQYEEFKDQVGQIIFGAVNREEFGNIIVDVSVGEAVIPKSQRIGRETPIKGERIRAIVTEVSRELRGPQVRLSRTSPEFLKELFRNEVPEFYDGSIDIVRVARDPGSRAKIAVVSYDSSIDPVGACVGMRGSRVQAVVNELQGERIDVIPWMDEMYDLVTESLRPAKVLYGLRDKDGNPSTVVVPDSMLALAIGSRGQNVRLARSLTQLDLTILTESEDKARRETEVEEFQQTLMKQINIDGELASYLVADGVVSVDVIVSSTIDQLEMCEGIDADIAAALQERAREYIEKEAKEAMAEARRYGLEDDLAEFEQLSPQMLLELARNGITSLRGFAECATWELVGGVTYERGQKIKDDGILESFDLSNDEAEMLIMTARAMIGIISTEELMSHIETEEITEDAGEGDESWPAEMA